MFEKVFVTVGTTSFPKLVELGLSERAIEQFVKWDVKNVRVQGGKGNSATVWTKKGIQFELYDYKSSIKEDMQWADLIICHAGAGTSIEALDLGKILLVVPNETLMENHQKELADKLELENYAFMATVDTFYEKAAELDPSKVKPFPPAQPHLFAEYLKGIIERDV